MDVIPGIGLLSGLLMAVVRLGVNLVVGGLALYLGAGLVLGEEDFGKAIGTALIGAIAWGVVAAILGLVPVLGGLLGAVGGFAVYLTVVAMRYECEWAEAAVVSVVAWLAAEVAVYLIRPFLRISAIGVPGV